MLLKCSPLVDDLALYDIVNSPGVAVDLSHINTKGTVKGYLPPDGLRTALRDADVVVIAAGALVQKVSPHKIFFSKLIPQPGMSREGLSFSLHSY